MTYPRHASEMRILIAITSVVLCVPAVAQQSLQYPVSIPQECFSLAKREGVPFVIRNERQATRARAILADLDASDPSVRECRQAVRRAMAR
jgi:hypothetical protein